MSLQSWFGFKPELYFKKIPKLQASPNFFSQTFDRRRAKHALLTSTKKIKLTLQKVVDWTDNVTNFCICDYFRWKGNEACEKKTKKHLVMDSIAHNVIKS